jgi:hypothetical protein
MRAVYVRALIFCCTHVLLYLNSKAGTNTNDGTLNPMNMTPVPSPKNGTYCARTGTYAQISGEPGLAPPHTLRTILINLYKQHMYVLMLYTTSCACRFTHACAPCHVACVQCSRYGIRFAKYLAVRFVVMWAFLDFVLLVSHVRLFARK